MPVIAAPVRVAIILHTNDFANTLFLEYPMDCPMGVGYSPFALNTVQIMSRHQGHLVYFYNLGGPKYLADRILVGRYCYPFDVLETPIQSAPTALVDVVQHHLGHHLYAGNSETNRPTSRYYSGNQDGVRSCNRSP